MRRSSRRAALLAGTLLLAPSLSRADAPGDEEEIEIPPGVEAQEDPILERMRALDRIAPFEDLAPLWDRRDPVLQGQVEAVLAELGLSKEVREKDLAVVLVDISTITEPKVAEVNGDVMMYAASLPKIAVLLAAFEHIAQGKMVLDDESEELLNRMIRESSNGDSTALEPVPMCSVR